jgi:hypothetical protein
MFVVEIGILHREKALVHVGFYRRDEALSDITKDQIISGVYSIVPEIFRDHVLKRLNIAKYTILFNGFDVRPNRTGTPGGSTPPAKQATSVLPVDVEKVVLAYAIVDLMSDNLDKAFLKVVQAKIKQLGAIFVAMYGAESELESPDFEPFKQQILAVFKDMLKKPEDRFDDMWPGNPAMSKKRK